MKASAAFVATPLLFVAVVAQAEPTTTVVLTDEDRERGREQTVTRGTRLVIAGVLPTAAGIGSMLGAIGATRNRDALLAVGIASVGVGVPVMFGGFFLIGSANGVSVGGQF